jgi:predicted ATPase
VLLERETFLDVLGGPPGRLVLVGGEAGVGKTALVREFAEDRRALWGACDPLQTPRALGPRCCGCGGAGRAPGRARTPAA